MYSEIKSSDKILINRLDENEKILLKDMYKMSTLTSTILKLDELTDESGEFGGVMLNFYSSSNKDIELETEIPNALALHVGDSYSLEIESNVENLIIYNTCTDKTVLDLNTDQSNTISFSTLKITSDPVILYYSIVKEGYNTINGLIEITVSAKNVQPIKINISNDLGAVISNYSLTIADNNNTQYISSKLDDNSSYAELPKGTYRIVVLPSQIDLYDSYETTYEVTDELLSNPNNTVLNITLSNK